MKVHLFHTRNTDVKIDAEIKREENIILIAFINMLDESKHFFITGENFLVILES